MSRQSPSSILAQLQCRRQHTLQTRRSLKAFPAGYDFSISEIHHTGKKDAPSGTAIKLEQIISQARGYTKTVYGREGISPRKPRELESSPYAQAASQASTTSSSRDPTKCYESNTPRSTRNVFAQGAVLAAEWLSKQTEPKVYSMADVLGLA